jgi:hypothetical protein
MLLALAMTALGESQQGLGDILGLSRRTISRWAGGRASLGDARCITLARAVYPRDAHLAARIVATRGATLEDVGIVSPAAPAPPPPAPPPPPPPAYLVEVVVCAAAEALDASPRVVRPALLAAIRTARAVGLGLEAMEKALSLPLDAKAATRER